MFYILVLVGIRLWVLWLLDQLVSSFSLYVCVFTSSLMEDLTFIDNILYESGIRIMVCLVTTDSFGLIL